MSATPPPDDTVVRTGRPTREELVDVVIELLRTVGPQAVQARRIAAEAGATTIVVYRRFGGMPQLVTAVVEAGFDRLSAAFADRPEFDDPVAGFCDLALTYRGAARANPHLFDLMFGLSNPGGYRADQWASAPDGAGAPGRRSSYFDRAYEPLVRYARLAIAQDHLREGDPESIAAQLWSFSHGFVVLELAGHFAPFADPLREVFAPMATNLVVGLGDDPGHAAAVMRSALITGDG